MTKKAIEKINTEFKGAKLSQKGKVVGSHVVKALCDFCLQNSEFAQAVVQSNNTVGDCIESTIKGCGSSISDIEVYRKAVEFYFSGATIRFNMTIDLGDDGFSNIATLPEEKSAQTALQLSLDDLLM